jgi:hypothetical protein
LCYYIRKSNRIWSHNSFSFGYLSKKAATNFKYHTRAALKLTAESFPLSNLKIQGLKKVLLARVKINRRGAASLFVCARVREFAGQQRKAPDRRSP